MGLNVVDPRGASRSPDIINAVNSQAARSHGTMLFDGDCRFCSSAARRAARINPGATVIAWQLADLEEFGVTPTEANDSLQYIDADRHATGADAVGHFLVDAGGWYAAIGRLLLLPGVRSLARPTYRWIASHRDRLPGGSPACRVP
jgi:predicted DCC family thiol-disulfide oxidoreductase YuxK